MSNAVQMSPGTTRALRIAGWSLAAGGQAGIERMLELLEPYRGQRGRVQRYLEVGRITAPRYGPRLAPRGIATI